MELALGLRVALGLRKHGLEASGGVDWALAAGQASLNWVQPGSQEYQDRPYNFYQEGSLRDIRNVLTVRLQGTLLCDSCAMGPVAAGLSQSIGFS